jgi:2-amino-4-hydroxy-6-hydroxymethyldihydropteridine diphosphokinase
VCTVRVFVGLGSNLGDRAENLRRAVEELGRLPSTTVRAVSSFRDTAPVGYVDQPRFLNGAVELETGLSAQDLLAELLRIERELGRDRSNVPPQGPRTVDLDLLLYGAEEIRAPGLEVPHPRLHERAFVLEPLIDLDAGLFVPGRGQVQALLAGLELGA